MLYSGRKDVRGKESAREDMSQLSFPLIDHAVCSTPIKLVCLSGGDPKSLYLSYELQIIKHWVEIICLNPVHKSVY